MIRFGSPMEVAGRLAAGQLDEIAAAISKAQGT